MFVRGGEGGLVDLQEMSYTCEILSSESQSFKLNFIPIEVSEGRTVSRWFNSSVHQL